MVWLGVALLGGCARQDGYDSQRLNTVAPTPVSAQISENIDREQLAPLSGSFANYIVALHAGTVSDHSTAASVMYDVWQHKPDYPDVAYAAFNQTILAGRFTQSRDIAQHIRARGLSAPRPNDQTYLSLFLAIQHIQEQQWDAAKRELEQNLVDVGVARYIKPLLLAWIAAGEQDHDLAIALLEQSAQNSPISSVYLLNQAYIHLHQAEYAKAAQDLRRLMDGLSTPPDKLVTLYSQLLYLSGGASSAQSYVRTLPAGLVKQRLEQTLRLGGDFSAQQIAYPSVAHGFAEGLNELTKVLRQEIPTLGLLFSQLVLMLDADNGEATLIAADTLIKLERYREAIMKLNRLGNPASPLYFDAVILHANAEQQGGDTEASIAVMRRAIARFPDVSELYYELGQVYQLDGRDVEAAEAYTEAITRRAQTHPADPSWSYYYFRGIAYEQTGRWPLAEADFLRALEIDQDNPFVLNYLGYTWIEQRKNINQALAMLETAMRGQPNNGFIIDSYGWALYRLGRYEEAVEYLEQAVLREPAEAVINEHLGDVYWQVGRKREAKYQWQHALSLELDTPEERQKVEDKLYGRATPEK